MFLNLSLLLNHFRSYYFSIFLFHLYFNTDRNIISYYYLTKKNNTLYLTLVVLLLSLLNWQLGASSINLLNNDYDCVVFKTFINTIVLARDVSSVLHSIRRGDTSFSPGSKPCWTVYSSRCEKNDQAARYRRDLSVARSPGKRKQQKKKINVQRVRVKTKARMRRK